MTDVEGKNVRIPASRLYRQSNGIGPGQIIPAGTYLCSIYNPGAIAPIHIDQMGWVKCYPTGFMYPTHPNIYQCESSEPIYYL